MAADAKVEISTGAAIVITAFLIAIADSQTVANLGNASAVAWWIVFACGAYIVLKALSTADKV